MPGPPSTSPKKSHRITKADLAEAIHQQVDDISKTKGRRAGLSGLRDPQGDPGKRAEDQDLRVRELLPPGQE
jgi:hypothetical protein